VHDIKVGRERLWELEAGRLDDAQRTLQQITSQWDRTLARLKALVEG
jgi:hypothetical protein